MRRAGLLVVLCFHIVCFTFAGAQGLSREVRRGIIEAVVQIIPWDDAAEDLAPWSGSGTIISADGYILTNFHVIGDTETRQYYRDHAIFMSAANATDQPPEFRYWAQYVAADPTHDLAILKIYQYPDGSFVPTSERFPSVSVGDSNQLIPGDTITIVGYPGISGSTITFTAGLMSGWLGEDWNAGGKQWIKTDAKIAHGNSGGGAFNEQGELIGVPTAGMTQQYAELDVEEQAYVRPASLAWALIGPNVPSVNRATAQAAPTPTPAPSPTPTPSPTPNSDASGDPSGEYGTFAFGSSVEGRIAGSSEADGATFHGYSVEVPAGLASLTVQLSGGGADLDLAVNAGAAITGYEEGAVDFLATDEEPNPSYSVANPAPGPLYIDVINTFPEAASYRLAVEGAPANPLGSSGSNSTGSSSGATGTDSGGTLEAGAAPVGMIGALALGQRATGVLAGVAGAASYHTYVLEVPSGTTSLSVVMSADTDLDLAAKFGAEISSYQALEEGGDWDYRDNSSEYSATFEIPNPPAGALYIDVINFLGEGSSGSYTLSVR